MKIFIAADHRGFSLKKSISVFLKDLGHDVVDVGTHVEGVDCDYPPLSREVAMSVVKDPNSRGILLCMTGIGHSIAANKVPGARAALVYNVEAAALSRQHNDSNILVLGSKFSDESAMKTIIRVWLEATFEGGRHQRRVDGIRAIEQEFLK